MEDKKVKRKEWVKTAAIIFLSIMLILTLFSNTIMNYSLPEVVTEYIMSDSITSQVRGTGTVEVGDPYSVIIEENRVIKSVAVKNGDEVEKGQTLFYLEDSVSEEMETLMAQIEEAELAYKQALLGENVSNSVYNNVQNGVETDTATYQANVQAQKNKVAEIEKTITDLQNQVISLETQIYSLGATSTDLTVASTNADMANAAVSAAQTEYNSCKSKVDNYDATTDTTPLETYQAALSTAESNLKAKQDAAYVANSIVALIKQLNTTNANLATANNNLAAAQSTLAQMQTDVQTEIGLLAQKKNIEERKAELAEMEEKAVGGVITAPIAGTVSGISHVAGESIMAGETVAIMQAEGKGYSLSFTVTNKQAAALSVGDKGTVSNSWYYSDVVATLISIKPDTTDPTNSKKLTFNIEGEVTAGQTLTLSVGQKSSNYEYTVPNSAIREDKDGKFILIIEQKSSPLGNRYYAVRQDIEVLASDDRRTAISGDIYEYSYVVTTSTKPIEEGQMVRLQDN